MLSELTLTFPSKPTYSWLWGSGSVYDKPAARIPAGSKPEGEKLAEPTPPAGSAHKLFWPSTEPPNKDSAISDRIKDKPSRRIDLCSHTPFKALCQPSGLGRIVCVVSTPPYSSR